MVEFRPSSGNGCGFTRLATACETRWGLNARGGEGLGWLLVQTLANAEARAQTALTAVYRNFIVYYPQILVERRHARKRDFVPRSLFPRYIFVCDDGHSASQIKRTPGVSHVVKNAGVPIVVGQALIDEIKARAGEDGFVRLDAPPKFKRNDPVQLEHAGSLVQGLFQEMTGQDRAAILLGSFGRLVVNADRLEPASMNRVF